MKSANEQIITWHINESCRQFEWNDIKYLEDFQNYDLLGIAPLYIPGHNHFQSSYELRHFLAFD
jgi:hypothetical protein